VNSRSMKTTFLSLLILIVGAGVAGLAGGDDSRPCDYKAFGLDGAKFFLYLTKDTPYARWQLWPGKEPAAPAKGPHGPVLTRYVNPAAYQSIGKRQGMAFGSLIVMENRDADSKLRNLAVKIKIKGYNPEAGDWYWFLFDPDGKIEAEGRVGQCIACHGEMKANDFVMTGPVK